MFAASLTTLPPRLARTLGLLGATQPGALRRLAAGGEDCRDVLVDLGAATDVHDWTEEEFEAFRLLLVAADRPADRNQRHAAAVDISFIHMHLEVDKKRRMTQEHEKHYEDLAFKRGEQAPAPKAPRTSLGAAPLTATKASGGLDVAAIRGKAVRELYDILLQLKAPVIEQLGDGDLGDTAAGVLAGGRRARTLRTRIRGWKGFAAWLKVAHDETWPTSWARLAEYLESRASEPCSRAVISHIYQGVRFIQEAGGFEAERAVTDNKLLKRLVKELQARLGARAGGGAPVQAPRPLLSHLESLELAVLNVELSVWIRAYAWWMCIKCWAVLRYDDHFGIEPSQFCLDEVSFHGMLHRSKTTGTDKKVRYRSVSVHRGAYLVDASWLPVGYDLWASLGEASRSYFLETPCPTLDACTHRALRYHEAAAWSRRLLVLSGALGTGERASTLASFYTEHSARSFLPSAGLAAGFSDEELKPLGGWSASNARAYIRTANVRLHQVQLKVAGLARRSRLERLDFLGEREEAGHLVDLLVARGANVEEARAHVEQMLAGVAPTAGAAEPAPPSELENQHGDDDDDASRIYVDTSAREENVEARVPAEAEGYCVSVSAKTKFRRLHYVGRCHRVPGIDYMGFEWYGQERPPAEAFDATCKQCWKVQPASASSGRATSSSASAAAATRHREASTDEDDCSTDDSSSSIGG